MRSCSLQQFKGATSLRTCNRQKRTNIRICAEQSDPLKKIFRQIQSSLPIVGLVSRLTKAEGGAVTDRLEYPEYSRSVYEAAPQNFQIAVADMQTKYGKAAQRRYILFCLWMTKFGVGVIPSKNIVDAARRVKVSQDLEFEMDRFNGAVSEVLKDLRFIEPPKAPAQQTADVAVDALCRLIGIKDGVELDEETSGLIKEAVVGGFHEDASFEPYVVKSIATRSERANAYA